MSKRGYQMEREIELFACKNLNQDPKADFFKRSYRTATSGTHNDGDVRIRSANMPFMIAVECKHRTLQYKGDYAFRLDKEVLEHIIAEAKNTKEPTHEFSLPTVCFAFKRAVRGRVWFIFPFVDLLRWIDLKDMDLPVIDLEYKKTEKHEYVMITRNQLCKEDRDIYSGHFPGMGNLIFVSQKYVGERLKKYGETVS